MISRLLAVFLISILSLGCQTPSLLTDARTDGWNHYGARDFGRGVPVALGALKGREIGVITEGVIVDVCVKKGCWMRMTDEAGNEVFVRFKDYGFFVPRNASGHRVILRGETRLELATVDELRHYAEDAGKSAAEIAAITEADERMTLYADSVYIEGADLDAPYSQ